MPKQDRNPSAAARGLQELLAMFEPDASLGRSERIQKALYVAHQLQQRASTLQTPHEKTQQAELDRMIQSPHDKATLTEITDQAFRAKAPHRAADQLVHILDVQGIPRFFSRRDRALLKGFQSFGSYLPGVAVPLVKEKMQHETANVILPAEEELLKVHLRARSDEGLRMNVNFLGEALQGEREAERRLAAYLAALQIRELEVLSVKISTIYSQIRPLARRRAVAILSDRMELLYRGAAKLRFTRPDGQEVPKFIYLDMEEYRDVSITAEVFMNTLDRPGLEQIRAGIALQAYLPDSFLVQQQITQWALVRTARGGAPVTIRLVKGANMEMERVLASQASWPQAPFKTKPQTDANYKRMLHYGCQSERLKAVRLGIASHNLFDLAYGLVLAEEQQALASVQFEMLEGMANHQRRALFEMVHHLLLYAPACAQNDFIHAIGYLIRRLDENTGGDNFLRHAFHVQVDSPQWHALENDFVESFPIIDNLREAPRREQNRLEEHSLSAEQSDLEQFTNESDTDFSLSANYHFAENIIEQCLATRQQEPRNIPLVIDGEKIFSGGNCRKSVDPSEPARIVATVRQATSEEVARALRVAQRDQDGWRDQSPQQREMILMRAAEEISRARGELMAAALTDGGKTLGESDPEVSEAIDFARFYTLSASDFFSQPDLRCRPIGAVVVVSPWNFPIAIPCGGVAAALAAGNTVILKPASEAVLPAYLLCECFYRAGISRRTLQLVPCRGTDQGAQLAGSDQVDAVILTGGTATAEAMLRNNPAMNLLAETGGKNATIVTALADRDQAIAHVLHSAFGHSGQKCSATSLLILEGEVYDAPHFKEALVDAAESLAVGPAWQLESRVGPLIHPPDPLLASALFELEPRESWALRPRRCEDNPQLISPAIKWDVQPGSVTHMTEFFGPVLGVMRADNLEHAIELVNATGYGLTSGLESLDDREQHYWEQNVRAGNLYINRPTTGAIVLRQPFGGMGKSAFGPGIKAGGPNYVAQLLDIEDRADSKEPQQLEFGSLADLVNFFAKLVDEKILSAEQQAQLQQIAASYEQAHQKEFSRCHDHFRLIGQDNIRRYLPAEQLVIRLHRDDSSVDILARLTAAKVSGADFLLSYPETFSSPLIDRLAESDQTPLSGLELIAQSDAALAGQIEAGTISRLRYSSKSHVPDSVRSAAAANAIPIIDRPVLAAGRIELLWYHIEQSLSFDYHRYGNLGNRSDEQRSEPL